MRVQTVPPAIIHLPSGANMMIATIMNQRIHLKHEVAAIEVEWANTYDKMSRVNCVVQLASYKKLEVINLGKRVNAHVKLNFQNKMR